MSPRPKDPVPQDLINYIEAAMEIQNLSSREVAKRAGMDPAGLWRMLKGRQGLPGDAALVELGKALNLRSPAALLFYARRVPEDDPFFVELLQIATELKREDFRDLLSFAEQLRRRGKKADAKIRGVTQRRKTPRRPGPYTIG